MLNRMLIVLLALAVPTAALADSFTLTDTGLNRVTFESEAPFETITGISTSTTGAFRVDLAAPGTVAGNVEIPVNTLKTGNGTRDEHLTQEQWLNAGAHPKISFKIESATFPGGSKLGAGSKIKGKAKGSITIKGVTKVVEVPVVVSYHAASDKLARLGIKGDVLRVKGLFKLNIRDFGVVPPEHIAGIKVADEVSIKVDLTATKG